MVGVLAMAAAAAAPPRAPEKDLDIQPCKKPRKEDDGASCKTITEYMSPIRKTADKVFSPPKSNNILDYFKRTSPINEKPSVAKECKIQSPKSVHVDDSKEWKTLWNSPSNLESKSRGKRLNLSQQLNDIKKLENEPIIINSDDSREETSHVSVGSHSDASALFTLKNVQPFSEGSHSNNKQSSATSSQKDRKKVNAEQSITKNDSKKLRKRKHKDDKDLTRNLSLEKESNQQSKKEPKDNKQGMGPKTDEVVNLVRDSSPGVHMSETTQVNDNTVTVSYEEFLKSQEINPLEHIQGPKTSACSHSDIPGKVGKSGNTSDPETSESSQQLPLKTVTVLAQIHAVPPKPISGLKGEKALKIPSIFLKQKESEIGNKLPEPENEQTVQKRKSNVVIAEEELELAVLDTGGPEPIKPKCTVEERQQFMNAFRQPAFDTVKSGVKKSLERQKDAQEKSLKEEGDKDDSVKVTECPKMQKESNNDNLQPCDPKGSPTKGKSKKLRKKCKRILAPEETTKEGSTSYDVNIKQSPHSTRRSLRQRKTEASESTFSLSTTRAISKGVPDCHPLHISTPKASHKSWRKIATPIKSVGITCPNDVLHDGLVNDFTPRSTRKSSRKRMVMIGHTGSENMQIDSSGRVSTKATACTSLEQHGLYMAELITGPFDSKSPIRMKFTRISSPPTSKKTEIDEDFTPKSRKASNVSKNISKAKRLIEKAKATQQNKSKVNEGALAPLRRSSRKQALTESRKLSEGEDSVIIIDSSPASLQSTENKQKEIQCLNDVLGRRVNKTAKDLHGKIKVAPLFLPKKPQKTAEPIVIVDDNSQDVSENSQDDEQFKAKREFLMSGLPDSLKRHIAKRTAALEAYSVISSCFQTVVHVQQRDNWNRLWSLTPPSCPLLTDLKDLNTSVTNVTKHIIALGEFSALNSRPSSSNSTVALGPRKDFTEEIRKILLEEIRWSNPQFPLERFFTQFLKKRTEHQALSGCQSKQGHPQIKSIDSLRETKRKRGQSENHRSKRRKPDDCDQNLMRKDLPEEPSSSRRRGLGSPEGRCSKTSRKKQATLEDKNTAQDSDVVIIDGENKFPSQGISNSDSGIEDMLWTEKYQPQDSSELIDNEIAIQKLHSWLKDWKRRAELEEKGNLKVRSDDKEQDLSFSMDFKDISDDEEENSLCNTVLITGPPGVGKTAAIYACAQELGFKIFEVNASSQRSGRQILSQLKEATQSHQVDKQGVNSQKPCFFNNYSVGRSPKKLNSPKKVLTSPRKPPLSPRVARRGLPPKTLANYFKVSSKHSNDEVMKPQKNDKEIISSEEKQNTRTKLTTISNSTVKDSGVETSNRRNATSLILFEEVDVVFDEDAGFLNAVKTFMATTKRPVILTTSDPTFSLTFDGCFEEIIFKTPSLLNVASYLQTLCLAENLRTDVKDFVTLLTLNNGDIRRSLLYLQFWVRSGGGFLKDKPLALHGESDRNAELICSQGDTYPKNCAHPHKDPADLPKCNIGCAESLLGIKNIVPPSEDLFSFIKDKSTTQGEWHRLIQLLTEFQKQNVSFLNSNLEFVLPLPIHIIPESKDLCVLPVTSCAWALRNSAEHAGQGSGVAKAKKTRRQKKIITLDDSDLFDTSLDCFDDGASLPPASSEENSSALRPSAQGGKKKPLESSEQRKFPTLASRCLNSLTEFMDNMSFLDSLLPNRREQKEFGKNEGFTWTHGKVKNGLCDEFSQEPSDGCTCGGSAELRALLEALSFTKCSSMISQTLETSLDSCKKLGKDPTGDLTLYVSQQRNSVYFSQSAADLDKAQQRLAVINTVFSGKSLVNLGSSRQASLAEYLPTLRSICRMEKLKEREKNKRRFLHYFEGIHLDIPKDTVSSLATDFP